MTCSKLVLQNNIYVKEAVNDCLVHFVNYSNYASLFAIELKKLLVNDQITA